MSDSVKIRLRQGTSEEWSLAEEMTPTKGNLSSGEIGLIIDENTDGDLFLLKGHLGINSTPTPISECPVIFMSELQKRSVTNGDFYISTIPVIYENQNDIPNDGILTWNDIAKKWEIKNSLISLEELPTQTGNVFYDSIANSFSVGELILAKEIDCGQYGTSTND
jgi:hypothetical protein